VPFLGEVPLNMQIRVKGDAGASIDNYADPIVGPHLEKIVAALVRNLAQAAVVRPPGLQLPTLG
jgi:ATP-binding protein involved in chromosome partitioning